MGRWSWSDRMTVEDSWCLSIACMTKSGVFREGLGCDGKITWTNASGDHLAAIGLAVLSNPDRGICVRLNYTVTERNTNRQTDLDYTIQLTTTRCNFGGVRYWFICPLSRDGIDCRRRVAKLYLPSGGLHFGCRHCHNLTYQSCKESNRRFRALMGMSPGKMRRLLNSKDLEEEMLGWDAFLKLGKNIGKSDKK